MNFPESYDPGPAQGAHIEKDGERWTLVVTRELRHAPAVVWKALTDPAPLRAWAPFESDRDLGAVGTAHLTTVGGPAPLVSETRITRADAPRVLAFAWGAQDLRWELEPREGGGTRLTLWHRIDRRFIAMGAAGWHVCLDMMDRLLAGAPCQRLVGMSVMQFPPWQRLHAAYAQQFGIETPGWGPGGKP